MKTRKIVVLAALFMMPLSLISCDREVPLTVDKTPNEIKAYVEKHFPGDAVLQTIKDYDGAELTYDVMLKSQTMLEFNRKKEIISIDAPRNACLPESVIPAPILSYVAATYPNACISDWSLDREGLGKYQEVELNNGMNLVFSSTGEFLRYDD